MFEGLGEYLKQVTADFDTLSPTEQIQWFLENLIKIGAVGAGAWTIFVGIPRWLKAQKEKQGGVIKAESASAPPDRTARPRWEYQWQVGDGVTQPAVEPPLEDAIVDEIVRAARAGQTGFLVFVRGELGIGKSTLRPLIREKLAVLGRGAALEAVAVANFLQTCNVFEAEDLEDSESFAARVNAAIEQGGAVVALARPTTLDVVERSLGRVADKTVSMLPFEPTKPLFHECIMAIATRFGLSDDESVKKLSAIASNFDQRFLQTPFYFEQVARAIAADATIKADGSITPLQIFQRSIEQRLVELGGSLTDLVHCALGTRDPDKLPKLAGIIGENGFVHDGYRNVLLAAAVVTRGERFENVVKCENALPAIEIILSHMKASRRGRREPTASQFEIELRDFVMKEPTLPQEYYPIFVQGRVADAFRSVGDEAPADAIRARCIRLVEQRARGAAVSSTDEVGVFWDVSDALSDVGDPRLKRAARERYGPDSGYFTLVEQAQVTIGSTFIPQRADAAKPLLPYNRGEVEVRKFYISNFLMTNEIFREFWDDPNRKKYFRATGRQWLGEDAKLLEEIEEAFDVSATRCFWKELREQEALEVADASTGVPTPLQLARRRALAPNDPGLVSLWDPYKTEERYSGRGKPVVGVNWWEAMAFCAWWTETKLPRAGFPNGAWASLPTDWEWEAVRRTFLEDAVRPDADTYEADRYPAHLRRAGPQSHGGRLSNMMQSLHVGLSVPSSGQGPTDLVGNVWEWTRSRVYGSIVASENTSADFGPTAWDDGDATLERIPVSPQRDAYDEEYDLSWRAVRGGSFFSRDEQAAWNPAYRLCDPPFSSYIDLGFRIAIYSD